MHACLSKPNAIEPLDPGGGVDERTLYRDVDIRQDRLLFMAWKVSGQRLVDAILLENMHFVCKCEGFISMRCPSMRTVCYFAGPSFCSFGEV